MQTLRFFAVAARDENAASSGGEPAAIGEHVPTLPAIEQDMQVPTQTLLQQMLSTQCPEAQVLSCPVGHEPPIGIRPQLMLTQVLPDEQSAAVLLHDILQAPVPHW